VEAGASFIVTGTVLEENNGGGLMNEFADAVHGGKS
jgi:heptaprenylglyceryl phosphate synthase